jgi:hypothetical protein
MQCEDYGRTGAASIKSIGTSRLEMGRFSSCPSEDSLDGIKYGLDESDMAAREWLGNRTL